MSKDRDALMPHLGETETPGLSTADKHLALDQDQGEKDLAINDGLVKEIHQIPTDNIPPEVRAVVPTVDDPEESCETFRSYFLGCIVTIVGTGLNCWFGARQPGIYLSPLLAQFVVHPLGMAMAKFLPRRHFHLGEGRSFTFNPGPWTVKEHTIVTMMATVSFPTATAIDIILATKLPIFFNDPELGGNLGYQFLIVLSTQFLGFGLAGMAREYLVYPSSMIWPLNLAKISLFNALHRRHFDESGEVHVTQTGPDPPVHGWKVTAFRFCLYATAGSFCYFFLSSFLLPFLTYFNWPTWISPTNVKLAIVMGTFTGFGLNPLPTLDWTYISGAGLTPLITPWWATLQIFIGCSLGLLIVMGIYFSNTWYSAYLLPNSNQAFDRFGALYNVTQVLHPDRTLDVAAYREYSPLYYTAGYNLVFGAYFAQYTAALLYALLEHWDQLKTGFRIGMRQIQLTWKKKEDVPDEAEVRPEFDIHFKLMRQYPEARQWWFAACALIALVMGIIACEVYRTTMPVWGIFLALALAAVFLVPAGIVFAISNIQITLVVLAEIIPGVAIPGRPYANMIFKIYGWIALVQALLYVQDQKLAHYLHVPPRATFRAQMLGCLLGSLVSIGIINWQMNVIPDLCVPGQKDLMTCPYYTTFYSSAILFGVVGPERVYGSKGLYKNLMFAFLVGAALTIVAWAVKRKWPNRITKSVNVPVIIAGAQYFAPYNWSFVYSGVPLAWFFMSYLYRKFPAWWNKYCYILSIGLTIGAAVSGVVQFFCITYPGARLTWWGNTFYTSGCDGIGCPLQPLPEAGYFGPAPGEYE